MFVLQSNPTRYTCFFSSFCKRKTCRTLIFVLTHFAQVENRYESHYMLCNWGPTRKSRCSQCPCRTCLKSSPSPLPPLAHHRLAFPNLGESKSSDPVAQGRSPGAIPDAFSPPPPHPFPSVRTRSPLGTPFSLRRLVCIPAAAAFVQPPVLSALPGAPFKENCFSPVPVLSPPLLRADVTVPHPCSYLLTSLYAPLGRTLGASTLR